MKRILSHTVVLTALLTPAVLLAQPEAGHGSLFEQLQERVDSATGQLAVLGKTVENVGDRLPRLQTRPAVVAALETAEPVEYSNTARGPRTVRSEPNDAGVADKPEAKKNFLNRNNKTPLSALKERETAEGRDSNMGMLATGMFLVGIVLIALWLKRRRGNVPGGRKTATIETIATSRLFGKHAISLVRVPGQILVLGASDKGMTLLTQLDEADFAKSAAATDMDDPGIKSGFTQRLQNLCEGFQGQPSAHDTMDRAEQLRRALNDDGAPVDQLLVSDERTAIRQRLSAMRGKA